ncbi:MAG: hypothetical protein Q8L39_10135 [Burkholderiales bacterium]|nr:hypothetical protein [Burkholderiales bacterium]
MLITLLTSSLGHDVEAVDASKPILGECEMKEQIVNDVLSIPTTERLLILKAQQHAQ